MGVNDLNDPVKFDKFLKVLQVQEFIDQGRLDMVRQFLGHHRHDINFDGNRTAFIQQAREAGSSEVFQYLRSA